MTRRILSTLLIASSLGYAQDKPVAAYKDIKYPPLRNMKVPQPARIELPNGMIVFLLEDHELPTVAMAAMIRTGGRYVPAEKAGLAQITGRVMRTGGTATRSGDDLDKMLDRLGASVESGIETDAGTGFVSVLKEDVDKALPIYPTCCETRSSRRKRSSWPRPKSAIPSAAATRTATASRSVSSHA